MGRATYPALLMCSAFGAGAQVRRRPSLCRPILQQAANPLVHCSASSRSCPCRRAAGLRRCRIGVSAKDVARVGLRTPLELEANASHPPRPGCPEFDDTDSPSRAPRCFLSCCNNAVALSLEWTTPRQLDHICANCRSQVVSDNASNTKLLFYNDEYLHNSSAQQIMGTPFRCPVLIIQ